MGSVFRALDRLHDREVALKLGHPNADRPDAARIADEFALLSTIDHPNLVRVLDLGRDNDRWWLTSELVAGPRLDTWVDRLDRQRPADLPRLLTALIADLLDALAWLHAQSLVHGDLKPANILVRDDTPVLIDFGLAGSGDTLLGGTRHYLAPELTGPRPGRPTPASDLFALGQTVLRLLERPTSAASAASTTSTTSSTSTTFSTSPDSARSAALATLTSLAAALTSPDPADRPTTDEALATLGRTRRHTTPRHPAWAGAIDRATAQLATADHLRLTVAPDLARPLLAALAARLMLADTPAWTLPDGDGLAPLAQLAAALGRPVPVPATRADDQREVLDAFADAMVAALRAHTPDTTPLPTLLVAHPARLGQAGRFVLARLVEARLLPHLILAGHGADLPLERGQDRLLTTLEVASAEASGRRFADEWAALSAPAQALARTFAALGNTLDPDAALALTSSDANRAYTLRRALAELNETNLTSRGPAGRTTLDPAFASAVFTILGAAPITADEHDRHLAFVDHTTPLDESLLAAVATHADRFAPRPDLWQAAAVRAELAFAWSRAADHHTAAARADVLAAPARAFDAAANALRSLRAAGPSPTTDLALAVMAQAVSHLPPDDLHHLEAELHAARVASSRGANADAIARTSKIILHPAIPMSLRFEAHLIRGTAAAQTEDKALGESDLRLATSLAESLGDLHALGRTANNLGLLAFHRGDLAAAADAWRQAADAKHKTADRRGERIGLHNLGLALRELGRLPEAIACATRASEIAEAIGDEVGRATTALARAQLAIDADDPAAAAKALAAFNAVGWKPALVQADGHLVTARLDLLNDNPDSAATTARMVLATALEQGLEPVAAESWALAVLASGEPIPVPDLVQGPLTRAESTPAGINALLLIASAFQHAQLGDWSLARRHLERVPTPLPLTARPGRARALETARLVAPALAAAFATPEPTAHLMHYSTPAAILAAPTAHPLERLDVLLSSTTSAMTQLGASLAELTSWPGALRLATSASRCELITPDLTLVDDDSEPRFTTLGKRVIATRRPFTAMADGRIQAFAAPLIRNHETLDTLGAAVFAFDDGLAITPMPDLGPVGALIATLIQHRQLEARSTRLTTENQRLEAELASLDKRLESEVTALRDALEQSHSALALRYDYGAIVHRSPKMRRVLETLDKVTDLDLPVLVLGESGVGKELLARALHFNGPRKKKRFIAENCGAIPKDLFESHFFGHVRGAFTGATNAREGLFEAAGGGTIFLDEVGELPLDMQVKLLRVLQDRKVRPVGSTREIPVDFRLVCATNRDLAQMVAEGRFREDLFYRIAVVRVDVPPLRERRDDILPIAQHMLEVQGARLGRVPKLSPDAVDRLSAHAWPGNVRELENEILRAVALCEGPEIKPRHFSPAVSGRSEPKRARDLDTTPTDDRTLASVVSRLPPEPLESLFAKVEKAALTRALEETHGQKAAAARLLGLSRPGLDAKLLRHGLDPKAIAAKPASKPRT